MSTTPTTPPPTVFNKVRYQWVKKRIELTKTMAPAAGGGANHNADEGDVVYSLGTLYCEWPDGTSFECNRYVDRCVVKQGPILQTTVWNDSGEWLLMRAGLTRL